MSRSDRARPATLRGLSARAAEPLSEAGDLLEVGVLTLDTALVIRGWNRWLETASGRSAAEVRGQRLDAVFPEIVGSPAEAALRRATAGEADKLSHPAVEYVLPLPPPPGYECFTRMPQSARFLPIVTDGGRTEGVAVLVHDLSERVAREQELRRAIAQAEGTNAAGPEFVAAMSHDFRTPLSSVIAYAEVMAHGGAGPVTPQQVEFLEQIRGSADHLARMIDEVLAFTTIDAGRDPVNLEAFDPGALASDTVTILEPQAREKGLEVTVEEARPPAPIRSDPAKVRQILLHLLGNALEYTDHGRVTVETATQDGHVVFRVRDTGPGIAREDLERIFEPFTPVRAKQRARRGTGLGLAVCRRLARLLGGELAADSLPGRGSTFTLRLPAEPPRAASAADASLRAAPAP